MGLLQYDRKNFFNGVGVKINSKNNLQDIIKEAGLDYKVEKVQNFDPEGEPLDSYSTRYFDSDGNKHNLGTGLKKNYTVLQNFEAFDFLQDMLRDLNIECAGSTHNGNHTFICASTEPIKILDDDISPYIVFENSFNGESGVNVMFTPIRVFCSNCMALATQNSINRINVKHSKNVVQKLYIARDILFQNTKYLESVKEEMESLATMRFTRKQFVDNLTVKVLQFMGLYNEDGEPIDKKRNNNLAEIYRDNMLAAWSANDLGNYENTGYAAIQAILDFESHREPVRNSENKETIFKRTLKGMLISDFALQYIKAINNNFSRRLI